MMEILVHINQGTLVQEWEEKNNRNGEENRLWKWFCWTCEQVEDSVQLFLSTCYIAVCSSRSFQLLGIHLHDIERLVACLFVLFIWLFNIWKHKHWERELECERETNHNKAATRTRPSTRTQFGERLNNRYGTIGMRKLFLLLSRL